MPLLAQEPVVFPEDLLAHPFSGESSEMRWRVLHTRPRAEKSLARRLYERHVSYFLPTYLREWRNQGRRFRSYLPLFSGYVFLFGDDESRAIAIGSNLVSGILEVSNQGKLLNDLNRVYRMISSGEPVTPVNRLEPGDPVQIVKGPLAGMAGKVIRRGGSLRLVVEVEMLRSAVSAVVESWMLAADSGFCTPRVAAKV